MTAEPDALLDCYSIPACSRLRHTITAAFTLGGPFVKASVLELLVETATDRVVDATVALSQREVEAFRSRHREQVAAGSPVAMACKPEYAILGHEISESRHLSAGEFDPDAGWPSEDVRFAASVLARWVLHLPMPAMRSASEAQRLASLSPNLPQLRGQRGWPRVTALELDLLTCDAAGPSVLRAWYGETDLEGETEVRGLINLLAPTIREGDALFAWLAVRAEEIARTHVVLLEALCGGMSVLGELSTDDMLCVIGGVVRDHAELLRPYK